MSFLGPIVYFLFKTQQKCLPSKNSYFGVIEEIKVLGVD